MYNKKIHNIFLFIFLLFIFFFLFFTNNKIEKYQNIEYKNLSDFIKNNKKISFYYYDDKIVKLNNEAHILKNHIRNNENKIYIDSITIDNREMYVQSKIRKNNSVDKTVFLIKKLKKNIKNSLFLQKEYTNNISKFNFKTNSIKKIKKNLFFFCYDEFAWGHKIMFGYRYFYYYIELKKLIPDLYMVTREDIRNKFKFVFDLLKIKDVIIIDNNEKIINNGSTYFVNVGFKFYPKVIDFYHNVIGKKSLKKYTIDKNSKLYPKKLLFLRSYNNIKYVKGNPTRILKNRNDIVELCSKYGYVDIDQTKYNDYEVIYLLNNATHLIIESGGSELHTLWTNKIKLITLVWDYGYLSQAGIHKQVNNNVKYISGSTGLANTIPLSKNNKVIFNNDPQLINYIKNGIKPKRKNKSIFNNIKDLKSAIEFYQ